MTSFLFSRIFLPKEVVPLVTKEFNLIQACGYAARKGTRERKRKGRVKVEVKKVGFIPHNLRDKGRTKGPFVSKRIPDNINGTPDDDVYIGRFYNWNVYTFEDALKCHRESHHPQILNCPDAPLQAFIELDMTGPKKTKFVESFSRMSKAVHPFEHGEDRSILVFCKTPELKADAENAGATLVGDVDLIKKVEKGDLMLPDFQFVLAHPNILPELVCLRGLMKKKFPNAKTNTLGINMADMVTRFRTGIYYTAHRDESEQDYGWIDTTIGKLDMEKDHLEQNLKRLIDDILSMKPKRPGPFITRIMLKSPPLKERFKIDASVYTQDEIPAEDSDSDDEPVEVRV